MTRLINYPTYQDFFEYSGNTAIHLFRKLGEKIIWEDWLMFDSVEEASDYFNTNCCAEEAA
jgi:hypothetical protein